MNGILISDCDTVRIGQPGAGNFITGNSSSGIKIADSSYHIALQNNSIGFSFVQGLGFPNGQNGIEVLNSYRVTIGGSSTEYANNIGFHLNNIYLGDSSRYCSVLHNSFFCSTNGIVIEPGSNDGISPANSFEIMNRHKVTGSSSANEHIQLYRKNPVCGTCQGNELLGSVQTYATDWVISFDSTLLEGDEVSLLRTDENGNTSVFSICEPFTCEPYEMQITPVGQDHICENGTLQLCTDVGEEFIWSTGETSDTITITKGGKYSVQVWDKKGCPSQDSILIQTFAEPSLEIYPADSTVFCGNYQILNASGQGKFAWNTGDSGPIIMVEESGTYCVTLTNQYNCQSVACVPITRGQEVNAAIEVPGDSVYCEGTPVLIRASGGTQYNWNTGQSGNSDSLWVTKTGLYKVTVSNEYGCSDTASVSITFNPGTNAFILPGGYLSICPNDSIELTAFGGLDYLWNTGSEENHIVVDSWGDYTVTVTNEYGCSDTVSQSVAVKPRIQARISEEGPVELCEGENYWLTVSYNIMDSIVWNDTLKADSILIDAPGTYAVEVFNLGCSIRDSVEVLVWPKPVRPDSITGPSWSNPDSIQYFSVFEYDPGMVYEWEVDGGFILTTAGGEVEIHWSDQDMGMICVAATDTNGCKSDLYCRMIDLAPLKNQYIEKENLLIYPNPANSLLNIEFGEYPGIRQLQLSFFHPSGQLINQRSIQLSPDEKVTTIEVSDIPGGIYWLKISGDQKLLHFEKILLNR
jgi:hypothetical protein